MPETAAEIIQRLTSAMIAVNSAADDFKSKQTAPTNQRLREAIQRCIDSESLIESEQAKFDPLIAAATNDIERGAREYQRWLVEQQLRRAAEWGRKRLAHLNALKTQADWDAEIATCEADTIYWFTWWAWSTDPRPNAPLTIMPLVLFPFQERYVLWLEHTAFTLRTSGLVEKSRDMGATVIWVDWDVKHWKFRDGFTSLLSTVDEDLVDSKKDPDTLFEKTRFQIKLLPEEMLPKGFDLQRDMPYMNIENAENHSVITGEAPTENIGRQRRRTVALFDEFASWRQGGYPQHTSASQTVPSIFKVSSVKGLLNKFAEESHSGHANIFRMNWREHPWKTQAWYDSLPYGYLGPPMTKEEIAQEIDCNYEASQPGRVFPEYSEPYHVITWSEFAAIVPMARNPITQNPKIPDHWMKACGLDWGATSIDEHPCALVWVTRAAANAPPAIRNCVFVYRERLWGNAPTVGDVAREVRAVELVEKEYVPERRLSHERSTEQATFAREHKMGWAKWQTAENWGVSIINEYLRIDPQKPHPFRPVIQGAPRLFLIAADGQGELIDDTVLRATGAVDADGLQRLRAEMPVFHYPESEKGKPVKEMRPMKFFDDACLVAGTLITTNRGDVPIEEVTVFDAVLTRCGFRRVINSQKTSNSAIIWEIQAGDRLLRGTGNHPVYVEGFGWKPLSDLARNDVLLGVSKSSNLTESSFIAIQTRNSSRIGRILSRIFITLRWAFNRFISKFGNLLTEMYRAVTTSIIETQIHSITTFPTWNPCQSTDTPRFTPKSGKSNAGPRHQSQLFLGASIVGLPSLARLNGLNSVLIDADSGKTKRSLWRGVKALARTAAHYLRRWPSEIKSIVPQGAIDALSTNGQLVGTLIRFPWIIKLVNTAERFSPSIGRVNTVPITVVRSARVIGMASTYNLTVYDQEEYFANGILTHNCAALRGIAGHFFAGQTPLTKSEYRESQLPEESRLDAIGAQIQAGTMKDLNEAWLQRLDAIQEVKIKQKQPRRGGMLDAIRGGR